MTVKRKRKKDQGLDFLVGVLKVIARNKDKLPASALKVMLDAADRLAVIDRIYDAALKPTPESAQKAVSTDLNIGDMLEKMKAQGGDNANPVVEDSNTAAV